MTIRFGVPSLDSLLGSSQSEPSQNGIELTRAAEAISLCIIGPEGTGKSILALHLASYYLADCIGDSNDTDTKILYISTDLTFSRAERVWYSFDLSRPGARSIPFVEEAERPKAVLRFARKRPVRGDVDVLDHLLVCRSNEVAFVDLAAETAGDDWGYVKRIVAALPKTGGARHLVIIDALEGFETLSGNYDAFGQALSRRSRIAQLMRQANDKAHVVFVVEDSESGVRAPEEFVTDVVLRLRAEMSEGYSRRTVEIEKVRGQTHARGRHYITFRKGNGSTTGRGDVERKFFTNHDDPELLRAAGGDLPAGYPRPDFQSYVHVFHSLHHQSRWVMERRETQRYEPVFECAPFGIRYLDEMLAEAANDGCDPMYRCGIPVGAVAALIGHPDTQKSRLGHAFLAEVFAVLINNLATTLREAPADAGAEWYRVRAAEIADADEKTGSAVLITTEDRDSASLARRFVAWKTMALCADARAAIETELMKRIVCRRLENHDLPTPILFHIVRSAIEAAVGKTKNKSHVRVVIEDYSTWIQIYPELKREALFLPFLLFYLRRCPVTALIIDTHPGRPDTPISDPSDSELRTLVDHQIYTWRVSFYGESRIAIAAIPPLSPNRLSVVRELKWSPPRPGEDPRPPEVDPHFELYTALEEGKPMPVPLKVMLFDEAPQFRKYIERENVFFNERFTAVPAENGDRGNVLLGVSSDHHGILRSFGTGHDTRLDYTLVFQADEFWYSSPHTPDRPAPGLLPRRDYLEAITSRNGAVDLTTDPGGVFRPNRMDSSADVSGDVKRISRFDDRLDTALLSAQSVRAGADRVPFMWDFGFLLCRPAQWWTARELELPGRGIRVGDVWASLPKAYGGNDEFASPKETKRGKLSRRPSWRDFLGCCAVISNAASQFGPRIPSFDLALTTRESLACLILEVWASEVYERLSEDPNRRKRFSDGVTTRSGTKFNRGLVYGIENFSFELYKVWLLLADSLDLARIATPTDPFWSISREASASAVATRHWYKSACAARQESGGLLLPIGLPGHFSTRGDWFLAAADSSRSARLADRAMDLLCSGTGNFARMQLGLGLPTVRLSKTEEDRIRTGLSAPTDDKGTQLGHVAYATLKTLGRCNETEFFWLWRSSIANYDSVAGIWNKWITRLVIAWDQFRTVQNDRWRPFAIYDRLVNHRITTLTPSGDSLGAWRREEPLTHEQFVETGIIFASLCALLKSLILEALPYEPPSSSTRSGGRGE